MWKAKKSILCAMTDLAMNVVKEEHLPVEETDDSCVFKYFEIVPLDTDTDVSSTNSYSNCDYQLMLGWFWMRAGPLNASFLKPQNAVNAVCRPTFSFTFADVDLLVIG